MPLLIASEAGDDEPDDSARHERNADQPHEEFGRRKRGRTPGIEDCVAALASLAGTVAMGLIKPAQAAVIRGCYAEIIKFHQTNESRDDHKSIADADVVELLRKDPKMLSMLEPFLTDEQIKMVMKNAKEGGPGKA